MIKEITRVFSPNSVSINLHDNTISLLSISVEFDRELLVRENVRHLWNKRVVQV